MDLQQLVTTKRIESNCRIEERRMGRLNICIFVLFMEIMLFIFRFGQVDVDIMTNYLKSVKTYKPASNVPRITILK